MSLSTQQTYEEVPYPNYMHSQTHPDRLATMAALYGMQPAPIRHCRVLELGCAAGGSLIGFADSLPGAEFVGIDLGVKHIEMGRKMIQELGLKNIELVHEDIMNIGEERFGRFDYIIAHGLFSWVPDFVREKILQICSANLNPQGVAYISYNAMPGGYFKQLLRDMMVYHVREVEQPAEKTRQAFALIQFLAASADQNSTYGRFIADEARRLCDSGPENLLHDHLASINQAFFFREFASMAGMHGLQFLSEADFFEMQHYAFPEQAREFLNQLEPDPIAYQQYLDFIKGKRFRQTLLCHQEIPLQRKVSPSVVRTFYIGSAALPRNQSPDSREGVSEKFAGPKGAEVSTNNALVKAALTELGNAWPLYLRFDELLEKTKNAGGRAETENDANQLAEALLEIARSGLVEFHQHQPPFSLKVGEQPLAGKLARYQARQGQTLTTLRCTSVHIKDTFSRYLIQLMDGTRDRAALIQELSDWVESSEPERSGMPIQDKEGFLRNLPADLERNLAQLARLGLLER